MNLGNDTNKYVEAARAKLLDMLGRDGDVCQNQAALVMNVLANVKENPLEGTMFANPKDVRLPSLN